MGGGGGEEIDFVCLWPQGRERSSDGLEQEHARGGEEGGDGAVVVVVLEVVVEEEEEEEVWCEERQGREGEVSRLLQCAGGDSVKCRAKASQSVPA